MILKELLELNEAKAADKEVRRIIFFGKAKAEEGTPPPKIFKPGKSNEADKAARVSALTKELQKKSPTTSVAKILKSGKGKKDIAGSPSQLSALTKELQKKFPTATVAKFFIGPVETERSGMDSDPYIAWMCQVDMPGVGAVLGAKVAKEVGRIVFGDNAFNGSWDEGDGPKKVEFVHADDHLGTMIGREPKSVTDRKEAKREATLSARWGTKK